MSDSNIRVRIAPSPTGFLHVGTARTALFNYLFAKHTGGKFILRIEDTDTERSLDVYTQNIYDSLKAMGLTWDEGPDVGGPYAPYSQMERLDTYKKYADQLLESGHAYYCYCTQEELDAEKEDDFKNKHTHTYSGKCKHLTAEQVAQYKAEGRTPTIRFSVHNEHLQFDDIIKGKLDFDMSLIGDFVIMKSTGVPTYNFAVVVDDVDMKISHVIRGEDHISNTPRQILVYQALGAEIPKFAHVGMILAPDRTKLSKRHGATAVSEFVEQGYLPEAVVNFVALLGWSPADGQEIKKLDELAEAFTLERVSSSPAIFEFDKLNWLNGTYIRSMELSDITDRILPYLKDYDTSMYSRQQLETIVAAVREPLVKLNEITDAVSYFFSENVAYDDNIKEDVVLKPETQAVLPKFAEFAETLAYEDLEKLHDQLAEFRKSMPEYKPKQIMWAIRSALTGRTKGADIAVIISVLGKDRVIRRTKEAIQ